MQALPESERLALAERCHIALDASKRISLLQQLARGLASRPQLRQLRGFSPAERSVLLGLAQQPAFTLPATDVDAEVASALQRRGWLFECETAAGPSWILPVAFALSLPRWEGEEPNSLRALLAQVEPSSAQLITRFYADHAAVAPWSLALESSYLALNNAATVRSLLAELPAAERRVLLGICEQGGDVDSVELLRLELQPARALPGALASVGRRGASYELTRRGLLIFVPPERHHVPHEVLQVLVEGEQRIKSTARAQLKRSLEQQQWLPRRAQYSLDPARALLALHLGVQGKPLLREGVGTPRSLITQLARSAGLTENAAGLLCALSRRLGLWDAAQVRHLPATLGQLSPQLFCLWLARGGGWDEARSEREVWRAPPSARELSPVTVLRRATLTALQELAQNTWVPWPALLAAIQADAHLLGIEFRVARWAQRMHVPDCPVPEILRRIVFDSLFTLGVVDVGDADVSEAGAARAPDLTLPSADPAGSSVRLSARASAAWLSGGTEASPPGPAAEWTGQLTLTVGPGTRTSSLLSALPLLELGSELGASNLLQLHVAHDKLAQLALEGASLTELLGRLQPLAEPSAALRQLLQEVTRLDGRAEWVAAAGFLWVDDPRLLEQLRASKAVAELCLEPSPPGGLLLAAPLGLERLMRICRGQGIELRVQGQRVKPGHKTRRVKA